VSRLRPLLPALLVVAMAGAAWLWCRPRRVAQAAPAPAATAAAAGAAGSSLLESLVERANLDGPPCPPARSLREVMRNLNGNLSQLSFALYHQSSDGKVRLDGIAERTGTLVRCLAEIPHHVRPCAGSVGFEAHAEAVAGDALALREAALEGDDSAARHWFLHVKAGCASCHLSCRVQPGRDRAPRGAE
jgi:hypothetical protein